MIGFFMRPFALVASGLFCARGGFRFLAFFLFCFFSEKSETFETKETRKGKCLKMSVLRCFSFVSVFVSVFGVFGKVKRRGLSDSAFRGCFCFTFKSETGLFGKVKQRKVLVFSLLQTKISMFHLFHFFSTKQKQEKMKIIVEGAEDGGRGAVFRIGFRVELDFYVTL